MTEPNATAEPTGASGGSLAWIPVTERMPRRGDHVLVAHRQYEWCNSRHRYIKLKTLGVGPARYWLKGHRGLQFCLSDGDVVQDAVAWMPFPEPPKDSK